MRTRVSANSQQVAPVPIVLLHGLGASGTYLLPTAELLATRHKVYVPDLPGFGASEKPIHSLSVDALGDFVSDWLEATGIRQAVFIGNSLGCQVVIDLAMRHPRQVHSAILIGPTVDSVGHTMLCQLWRGIRALLREPWALWLILARDYWSTGTMRLWETFHWALADPVQAKLSRIHVPVLVVRGNRDLISPQRWVEEVVGLLPRGHLAVVHNGTHATNFSEPHELVRVVAEFLSKHASGSPIR
jgi:2-hydroxy-6-oxonona-2,4-dienedioate hydrolase